MRLLLGVRRSGCAAPACLRGAAAYGADVLVERGALQIEHVHAGAGEGRHVPEDTFAAAAPPDLGAAGHEGRFHELARAPTLETLHDEVGVPLSGEDHVDMVGADGVLVELPGSVGAYFADAGLYSTARCPVQRERG